MLSSMAATKNMNLPLGWQRNTLLLRGVESVDVSTVKAWTAERVGQFINELTGQKELGDKFVSEEVDGESLLLLTQKDLTNVLQIKLGPALKIVNAALLFKLSDPNLQDKAEP